MTTWQPVMTLADLEQFIETDFPQAREEASGLSLRSVGPGEAVMRLTPTAMHVRPGGTVSGPSLFMLCDVAAYMAILAHIGPVGLTVTTNLNINFMHKAAPGWVDCTARLLKLGSRLAVTEMSMADHDGRLTAHATATYSIPPR